MPTRHEVGGIGYNVTVQPSPGKRFKHIGISRRGLAGRFIRYREGGES